MDRFTERPVVHIHTCPHTDTPRIRYSIRTSGQASLRTSRGHYAPQAAVIKLMSSCASWRDEAQKPRSRTKAANPELLFLYPSSHSTPDISSVSRMLPAPLMTYQYQRSFIKAASECFAVICLICLSNVSLFGRAQESLFCNLWLPILKHYRQLFQDHLGLKTPNRTT